MLSTARIAAIYQAACRVLTTAAEREHLRATYASPPSQWPAEAQVQGWPQPAQLAYRAATDRHLRALTELANLVPEAEAPLHFPYEQGQIMRVAFDEIVGDPRGGVVVSVAVYPLLVPAVAAAPPTEPPA